MAVLLHNEYPPSSDIGLHGSIINLILDEETLPTWNPYHMGGQILPTPPGFHFFVSILILFSGLPLLFAQLLTAAFYSSVIVFPAYLVSKRIWGNTNAGLLAAFFAAISALSLEMISWGGYTNVVSLGLIVTIMYLFVRDIDQPSLFNLLMGTLLFGGLILTHTFSLFVMFPVLILYFIFLLIGKVWKLKDLDFLKKLRFFVVSGVLGISAISPWLLRVFGFYIGASSEGSFLGGVPDNRNLILANRTVDSMILALFVALIPTFFLFKVYRKQYWDSKSLLIVAWFLVPLVMTQAYIFGVFVDYSRFMYFIDFPGIIIISAGLLYLFSYSSKRLSEVTRLYGTRAKNIIPVIVLTAILFVFILISPWSIIPNAAQQRADFYSTIQQPEYTTIEWLRNKTPNSAVLVADHLYGWWLSGISKRATLSAAGLEFLLYAHEMEVASNSGLILDTDYYFDNGLLQVRDDGPYISRHNPLFSIETLSGEVVPVFYFKDNETLIYYESFDYRKITTAITETQNASFLELVTETGNLTLSEMEITEISITKNEISNLTVLRENNLFTVNKTLQVYQGKGSVDLSYEITAKNNTNLSSLNFRIYAPSHENLTYTNTTTTSIIRPLNSDKKVIGQIYTTSVPDSTVSPKNYTYCAEVEYVMSNPTFKGITIRFHIEVFDTAEWNDQNLTKFQNFTYSPIEESTDDPFYIWDYAEMMENFNVTHIVCRDETVYAKFSQDPLFQFILNSGKVAIFQVKNDKLSTIPKIADSLN